MIPSLSSDAGSVGILNVGDGDTKLSFDPKNPAERIRAARIVRDMIRRLRKLSRERGDWAGIPMPLAGEQLVVEPNYPKALELMAMGKPERDEDDGCVEVNTWYSSSRRCDVVVFRDASGALTWGAKPAFHSLAFAMSTLNCADAWGIEQESNAVHMLGTLVSHRQFKQYMLTGTFIESSKRSGVYYLFRRLKPTVAIRAEGAKSTILCALCMHPIAYYARSWAGAMTPTDDVVAHLMMMRGDEAMFWRRSTQHPAWRPEAGL
ncbi:hypothetical protein [Polaromonas sp.]|uniref:hypothetical protein n=1 Tax=Polaromonas sp. TaxID=1869339 RepID=UPI0032649AA4